jgi:hypothetical protein
MLSFIPFLFAVIQMVSEYASSISIVLEPVYMVLILQHPCSQCCAQRVLMLKLQRTQAESKPRVTNKSSKKSDQQLVPDEEEAPERKGVGFLDLATISNLSITI